MRKTVFFIFIFILFLFLAGAWLFFSDDPKQEVLPTEENIGIVSNEALKPGNISITSQEREGIPIPEKEEKGNIAIKIFFLRNSEEGCGNVYAVEREVAKTKKAPRDSLLELFAGVTEEEEEDGYYTMISEEVSVQGMSVQHGVAFVDVNNEISEGIDRDCEVKSIRAQIDKTLMQFSGIEEVQLYVAGKEKNILQP